MKKSLLFICMAFFIGFSASATDYYIAANGNDANNGISQSTPWRSINKLNAYFSNLRPGDKVLFKRGDTFYGSITINKSGSAGAPITIGAYGSGEKPVITGFTSVISWISIGGNKWESKDPVSSLSYTNMVAINGVNYAMGRWPNSDYYTVQSNSGTTSLTSTSLGGAPNWGGAEVVVKSERYETIRSKIIGHYGNTLNFESFLNRQAKPGKGFFIQNDSKTLDIPGEWYYNSSSKKLQVFSYGTPTNVQIATIENLVSISKKDFILIENITFTGGNTKGVLIHQSNSITIQDCDFFYFGVSGIDGGGASANIKIESCDLKYINRSAITNDQYGSRNYTVRSNKVNDVALFPGMINNTSFLDHAITIRGDNNLLQYNEINNTGYGGIFFRGNNVEIRNNFIQNFCLVFDDGGGIYTGFINEKGKVIDGNIVLNSKGSSEGTGGKYKLSQGIFVDNGGESMTISNNTVANGNNSGIKIHNGRSISILNNTLYNNGDGISSSRGQIEFMISDNGLTADLKHTVKGNKFFAKTPDQISFFFTSVQSIAQIKLMGVLDDNSYARPIKNDGTYINLLTGDNRYPGYNYSLATWQNYSGQDGNSRSTPKTITDLTDLRFEYNASQQSKTISLDANYIDVKNNSYNGSITLAPYSSAVLIRNGPIVGEPLEANAGEDQIITLPNNSVDLIGSGGAQGRSTTYQWTKISGPSSGSIKDPESASTSVTNLVEGVYIFQLKITASGGATSTATVKITVLKESSLLSAINPANIVNGLDYKYYEESNLAKVPDFSKLTPVKTGVINNFDISIASRSDQFAVDYEGFIDVPTDGQYTFYTTSDDGSMLYIGDRLVVDNDGLHAAIEKSGTIGLKAGKHAIRVGFFERLGGEVLNVSYGGPGISKRAIPNLILFRSAPEFLMPAVNPSNIVHGLNYNYYEENNYTVVPDFSKLTPKKTGDVNNFDIGVADRAERFAINFEGYIDVPTDGEYTFSTTSDDGSILYINNILVVNNDGLHGAIEKSGSVGLKAGKHYISVGFFQEGWDKSLQVSYAGPGISKRAISNSMLYRSSIENLLPSLNPSNVVNGLEFKYYEGESYSLVPDFTKITPVNTGKVDYFDLAVANRSERYAISFTGYIDVPVDGQYSFYTTSDDGSVLYIDNKLVVDNDGLHSARERSGTIGLRAGKHLIAVGFFQQDWDKSLSVSYEGPGITKQAIPYSLLFRDNQSNGLNYSYYEAKSFNSVPDFSKISPIKTGTALNFDISVANRSEVFAIEFNGYLNIPTDGQYTFYTTSDDGSMLYINNKLVVNNDGLHSALERSGTVYLSRGRHMISVGFFQQTWDKMLQVMYAGPGISKRLIPGTELFTDMPYSISGFGTGPLSSSNPLRNQSAEELKPIETSAYPNPFINLLNVTLNGEAGEFKLQMIDAVGRIVFTRSGSKNEGYYKQSINTSSLQKGVYFLKIIQNDKISIIKVVK